MFPPLRNRPGGRLLQFINHSQSLLNFPICLSFNSRLLFRRERRVVVGNGIVVVFAVVVGVSKTHFQDFGAVADCEVAEHYIANLQCFRIVVVVYQVLAEVVGTVMVVGVSVGSSRIVEVERFFYVERGAVDEQKSVRLHIAEVCDVEFWAVVGVDAEFVLD